MQGHVPWWVMPWEGCLSEFKRVRHKEKRVGVGEKRGGAGKQADPSPV